MSTERSDAPAGIVRDLERLSGAERLARCPRLTTLFTAGTPADRLFLLESGLVKIVKPGKDGRKLLVCLVRPEELFGEQAAFSDGIYDGSAETVDECVIVTVPGRSFRRLCAEQPIAWQCIADSLRRRVRELDRRLEVLAFHRVEERILYLLIELQEASAGGTNDGLVVPLSQEELAHLVAASRETTSSILNAMERRGLVRLGRRQLQIGSLEALRKAALAAGKASAAQV